jgi:excinuclease ABC subunit C
MIVAGEEGFRKNQYRKFNIRSADITAGDDYGMMREVLTRRFTRLMNENPRDTGAMATITAAVTQAIDSVTSQTNDDGPNDVPPWPDLVLIDGGLGQLNAARATLSALGIMDIPLIAVAKGPDRDAGRETFFMPDKPAFKLPPRDPILYFVERLRDEAHRFAIGSHRQRRKRDIRESGLQDIPGIGPTRKRALLMHFGTLKAIENASLADLAQVPGISADGAQRIYDYFHDKTS